MAWWAVSRWSTSSIRRRNAGARSMPRRTMSGGGLGRLSLSMPNCWQGNDAGQRGVQRMNLLGGTRPEHGMSRDEYDELVRDLTAGGNQVRRAAGRSLAIMAAHSSRNAAPAM